MMKMMVVVVIYVDCRQFHVNISWKKKKTHFAINTHVLTDVFITLHIFSSQNTNSKNVN